jgi:hypothetical protein
MKNNETGHAKNVANMEKVAAICASFGSDYNPSFEPIQLTSLQTKIQTVRACISAINASEPLLSNAVMQRQEAFEPLDKLVTRTSNALKVVVSSEKVNENARALIRKIHGQRAKAKMTEEEKQAAEKEGKEIIEHSVAQTSYDSKVANFSKYIQFLASIAEYKPNEEDLTLDSPTPYGEDLKTKNLAVTNAEATIKAERIKRDKELYDENDGLVTLASKVKAYVKSIYGATSLQFKQLSSLIFVKH